MSTRQQIVFFGSGSFGVPTLERLCAEHRVLAIVTQPDRPAGRSQRATPTPIAQWAAESRAGAMIFKTENVNEPGVVRQVRAVPAEVFVVIAFGQKLGDALLADRFAINLHASLLPRWRGAAPINHAMLAGDAETGNSVITLAHTMDAGEILGQSRLRIDPAATAGELHDRLAAEGPALVLDILKQRATGALTPAAQDSALVTKAPKLAKEDGRIVFSQPAESLRRRIHALNPWPGVTVRFQGEPLRLLRARVHAAAPTPTDSPMLTRAIPGSFLDAPGGIVACGGGTSLRLLEVQASGGRAMPWADFARGRRLGADDVLIGGSPC